MPAEGIVSLAVLAVFVVINIVVAIRQGPPKGPVDEDREKLWWQAIK